VYEGRVPPQFVALLNPGAAPDASEDDLISLPVHPLGELLGSFLIRRAQGNNLVWLIFDVPVSERDVAAEVGRQLDETPWQIVGGQANESISVLRFQSTVSGDIDGTAVVQPIPGSERFELTVEREGSEVVLQVPRGAPAPRLEAEVRERDGGLLVTRVDGGSAREAGLLADDRLVAVAGKPVKSTADLDRALRELAEEDAQRSTLVYILEIGPVGTVGEPRFFLPRSRTVPDNFPARFLLSEEMTVVDIAWQSQPGGAIYQLTALRSGSATNAADEMRTALEAEDWEIVDDRAVGFATILQFADAEGRTQGTVTLDAFQRDEGYTAIVLQLQQSRASGN
jgi:hypothetical protein